MAGNGGQNFFIWDEVGAQLIMYIDSNRRVGLGTLTPDASAKLHVAGRVRATGYDTGDIKFANEYSVTEDEKDGLAFLNPRGQKIAVLDNDRNFHIKGDIIKDLWSCQTSTRALR